MRIVNYCARLLRGAISLAMLYLGASLAGNLPSGPCGGTFAGSPQAKLWMTLLGFGLIVGSYPLVKSLQSEGDFRFLVYAVLVALAISLAVPVMEIARPAAAPPGLGDCTVEIVRGVLGCACLFAFYRWTGVKGMIRRGV